MTSPTAPLALDRSCVAFAGSHLVARGSLVEVALAVRAWNDVALPAPIIFDARTGAPVEVDVRGTAAEVVARLHAAGRETGSGQRPGPGRPRIGVVAREVTLLPRHWEWLARQNGSASHIIRRLIDAQREQERGLKLPPETQQNIYRFMSAVAGNCPGFEAATRALFAGDAQGTVAAANAWPADVRAHLCRMIEEKD